MLPALTTKPKQPIKQIRGLTNDSIDSYANTPVGSTNAANVATTSYNDLTENAGKKQKAKDESDHANDDGDGSTVCVVARALRDRKPKSDEELTLKTGDTLNVYSTKKTGYLKCECNGKTGYVPASYVEFLDKETGEPSPRKKKKKAKKKSKKKKDRGSGSSDDVDEDEPDDEDVGRKKHRDKHSKKKDADEDNDSDDGKDDNDDGGSKKSKKKSARKSSRQRRKKRHSSDSNSSDEDSSRRRHRRRHRSRRRRGHDDDDDESDSPHSSDEDSEEERRRRRRAKKKANEGAGSDEEESDRGGSPKKKATPKDAKGDDRPQEKPKAAATVKKESMEDENENGQSKNSASTGAATSTSKDNAKQDPQSARRKDNEIREESTTKTSTTTTAAATSNAPKSTIGKMQDKMRSMLGKKSDGTSTKKTTRAKTQSNGILNACPGTVQGEEGWYEHGECERYYFILVEGKWSLLYGPMTDDDFELFCSKVLEYDLMIELPATHLHKSGYYLDKDFKVRHIKP